MRVVVGGQCSNAGKTTLITALLRALAPEPWCAVKVSRNRHGLGPGAWSVKEDGAAPPHTDTGLFREAGAQHVYWVRAPEASLAEAAAALEGKLAGCANVIYESNSILAVLQPDVYVLVADASNPDVKDTARRYAPQADVVIGIRNGNRPEWIGDLPWAGSDIDVVVQVIRAAARSQEPISGRG